MNDAVDALDEDVLYEIQRRLELRRAELIDRLYQLRRQRADEAAKTADEDTRRLELEHGVGRDLQEVRETLDRIANKTYGHCEACERRMEIMWLRIRPSARRCQACEQEAGAKPT